MTYRIKAIALSFLAIFALTSCATTNHAGVRLYKKPDLSKLEAGTPISKVASLKKPIKREAITKGELAGSEALYYEWDSPNDDVNNRMFTTVVVKNGIIIGYLEETTEKWTKNPKMYSAAKYDSSLENIASLQAQIASYQMATAMLANYNYTRPQFNPVQQATQNLYTYKPWATNSNPANQGLLVGQQAFSQNDNAGVWFPGRAQTGSSSTLVGNTLQHSNGSSTTKVGNTFLNSDGTSSTRVGNSLLHSNGSSTTKVGNTFLNSDGTSSTRVGNSLLHSDGGSTTKVGNTFLNQ